RGKSIKYDVLKRYLSLYSPFTKQQTYFNGGLTHRVGQMPQIFPTQDSENLVIYISGIGTSGEDFSVLRVDIIPDLNMQHSGGQGFPLYLYEKTPQHAGLFTQESEPDYQRKDAITDAGLAHFQAAYPQVSMSKEAIFYYIYGLLHSEDYRERYADNLA